MIQVSSYTKTAKRAGKSSFITQFKAQYVESDMDLDLCHKKWCSYKYIYIYIYMYIYKCVCVFSYLTVFKPQMDQ